MGMKAAVRSCTPTSDRAVANSSLFFCICFLFLILFFCFVGYCYEINKMPFYFCHYSTKFLLITQNRFCPLFLTFRKVRPFSSYTFCQMESTACP